LLEGAGDVSGIEAVERRGERRVAQLGAELLGAALVPSAAHQERDAHGGCQPPAPGDGSTRQASSSSLSTTSLALSATSSIFSVYLPPVLSSAKSAALSMALLACSPLPFSRPFSLSRMLMVLLGGVQLRVASARDRSSVTAWASPSGSR